MTGGKREIGWKRRDAEGQRVQVKAQKTGNRWHFHIRGRKFEDWQLLDCLLYTSPSPRDLSTSRMPSSA